jgi:hypothetical protein
MVHGNWYSARYEIYLTKPLDLYNDILPICSSIKYMLKYIQMGKDGIDGYKLIIIDTANLDKRFTTRPIANYYACALDTIEYDYNNKQITREKEPTMFEYQDVFTYANKIKHQNQEDNLFIPIKKEQLEELKIRLEEILDISAGLCDKKSENDCKALTLEYNKILKTIQIQPIIANPEYYNKIISMEQELTNIELTQEELDLIKAVETHPSLAGLIKFSGFNLANGFY